MYTRHNKPKNREVKYSRDNVVERAGYITTQKRAENLINAGKNLADWRKQQYTNEIEKDEPEVNRAARKDYDFADFHNDAKELNKRLKEKFSQHKMAEEELQKKTHEENERQKNAWLKYAEKNGLDFDLTKGEFIKRKKEVSDGN